LNNPNDQRPESRLDLQKALDAMQGQAGKEYWRGLDTLAETPEFQKWLEDEFPERASILQVDRRNLLKFMGASLMMASLSGCRSLFMDQERVVPYVKAPEDMVTGLPMHYASTMTFGGYACGVLVESDMGRPIKVDGNPDHPANLGSSDAFMQASLMDLYDPDRSPSVLSMTEISTWDVFTSQARQALAAQKEKQGAGIRIVTENVTSPSFVALLERFLAAYPQAKWLCYEPVNRDACHMGTAMAFGRPLNPVYDFRNADVVLSLDADFFHGMPGSVRYARDFMSRRQVSNEIAIANRLYCVESSPTLVGANADHVRRMKPSEVDVIARAVAARVGVPGVAPAGSVAGVSDQWLDAMVRDLMGSVGRALVVPGEYASPDVHALAAAINVKLQGVGSTVIYTKPVEAQAGKGRIEAIAELTNDLNGGAVDMLVMIGGNLAQTAPADLNLTEAIKKARMRVHMSTAVDETSRLCDWHLPRSHYLEAWGDARAYDGTLSLAQPLIAPLYQTWSELELVATLLGEPRSGYEIVRDYHRSISAKPEAEFDDYWRECLHQGMVAGTKFGAEVVEISAELGSRLRPAPSAQGIQVAIRPDPTIWDGRFANNGWLQECPKPLTTLTWDAAAHLSPTTAKALGVTNEDLLAIAANGRTVTMPVWVQPGHPDEVVTVHLGYGRKECGRIGKNVGIDAYPLVTTSSPWMVVGAEVKEAPGAYPLAATQTHHYIEGRDLVREGTLAEFMSNPENRDKNPFPELGQRDKVSMYPDEPMGEWKGDQWGMSIDLMTCIGCGACVVACQAENNIAVVGKEEVRRGREMHWIRIDRYYRVREDFVPKNTKEKFDATDGFRDMKLEGKALDPNKYHTAFQPVTCLHCEAAPCEPVCPVAATVHSHEGLNQMVYNRCVGTRYCSNNCPYKVRRFNFLNYADRVDYPHYDPQRKPAPQLRMINNPDVTVRGRGVMEKCTYCVQRINEARITAKKEGRRIRDGEVVTACEQACPTQAIVFGNIADPATKVARARSNPRTYKLLEELNTRPRTTYQVRIQNPNPEIENA
jgi:molybdopterin-containing oxidoreductase family iron-sulfur binding subunit